MLHVCLCDRDKVCPEESILFFYWLLQGGGDMKGRRPWRISFKTLSLSLESRGETTVTRKHLEKLYKLYIYRVRLVFTQWMDVFKECELSYNDPENPKKERKKGKKENPHRKWWQNSGVKLRAVKFQIRSGVADIIACIETTRGCLISCQHITSTNPRVQHPTRQMSFLCFSSARLSCEPPPTNAAHLPRKLQRVTEAHALNMGAAEGWEHVE